MANCVLSVLNKENDENDDDDDDDCVSGAGDRRSGNPVNGAEL